MQLLVPDAPLATLVQLDVLDMRLDGSYAINEEFHAACRAEFDANPTLFEEIVPTLILARAMARGLADGLDLDELTLRALEIAVPEI